MDADIGQIDAAKSTSGGVVTKKFTVGDAAKVELIGPGTGKIVRAFSSCIFYV